jgi:hypothetical protein
MLKVQLVEYETYSYLFGPRCRPSRRATIYALRFEQAIRAVCSLDCFEIMFERSERPHSLSAH